MSIPSIGSEVIQLPQDQTSQTNPIVRDVQEALNQVAGSTELQADGNFNRETEESIRDFQGRHHISGNGTINQATIDALNREVARRQSPTSSGPQPSPTLSPESRGRQILEQRIQEPNLRADLQRNLPTHYTDSLRAMTTVPQTVRANGVDVPVYGATPEELGLIQRTLERLPRPHVEAIPRIVVADTVAHGQIRRGGNSISDRQAERQLDGPRYRERLEREGAGELLQRESGLGRLELTHAALQAALRRGDQTSGALLHETAHFANLQHHFTRGITPDDLGEITYTGNNNPEGDPRGPVPERFADAYMQYFQGRLRDPAALSTMNRVIGENESPHQPAVVEQSD